MTLQVTEYQPDRSTKVSELFIFDIRPEDAGVYYCRYSNSITVGSNSIITGSNSTTAGSNSITVGSNGILQVVTA